MIKIDEWYWLISEGVNELDRLTTEQIGSKEISIYLSAPKKEYEYEPEQLVEQFWLHAAKV